MNKQVVEKLQLSELSALKKMMGLTLSMVRGISQNHSSEYHSKGHKVWHTEERLPKGENVHHFYGLLADGFVDGVVSR